MWRRLWTDSSRCCGLIRDVTEREFLFDDKDEARDFFVRITNAFRNLNYSATDSSDYQQFLSSIRSMLSDRESEA